MSARMPILVAVLLGGLCHSVDASEPDVEAVLARWAEASRQGPRLSAAILKTRYGAVHSAHELDAASALLGPVDAKMLQERFNWSGTMSPEGVVTLVAEPRDTVEQLFYDRLKITIDAATSLPASIRFVGADGTPRPVVIQQRRPRPEPMVLPVAAAEDDRSGSPVVHTAAFVPTMLDERGVAAEGVDVADVLRRWDRYRRSSGTTAVMQVEWVTDALAGAIAHAQGTPGAAKESAIPFEPVPGTTGPSPEPALPQTLSDTQSVMSRLVQSSMQELLSQYRWKTVAADASMVVLEATPSRRAANDRYGVQLFIEPKTGAWLGVSLRDRLANPRVPALLPPTVPATATGPIDATFR